MSYTYGVFPLQQYLVELPGGRLQALSFAWDARPREQGGSGGFTSTRDERIDHRDELHWTERQQNWNFMCADCHSTNVRKGYDPEADRFATTWSEINVGVRGVPRTRIAARCDGRRPPAWSRERPGRDNGLTARLGERRGVSWSVDATTGRPVRSAPRTHGRSRSNSARNVTPDGRRSPTATSPARPSHDFYVRVHARAGPVLSRRPAARRGLHLRVVPAEPHEPRRRHVLGLPRSALRDAARGRATRCVRPCHTAATYDATTHHFHQRGTAGAACVSCHMPARTYMSVDARRDHSFRVPRPDQSCRSACRTRAPSATRRARPHGPPIA